MAVAEAGPVPEAIVADLARMAQPDLSGFPPEQVRRAMQVMFGPAGLNAPWLEWLRMRLRERSGGTVSLTEADPNEFEWLSKQWGAVYQRLLGPSAEQLVIIGNTMPPVQFVHRKRDSTT